MSYILDALRKADAQRESDPARGIHAQPVRAVFAVDEPRGRYRRWFWGASAASVAAVGATAWYLYHDKDAVAIAQTFSPPPQPYASMPAAPASAAVIANPALPMQPPATGAPPATAVMPPVPAPVAPPALAGPLANPRFGVQQPAAPQAGQPAAPAFPQVAPVMPPAQTGQPPTMPARPAPPPAAPAPPPPPVAGLPADAPKLVVSGGVYSADRGQRMLIVNGQVYKEGADLGAGVQLEEIKPNAAVLRFRGARYTTTY
jgi:general secretion pathway protein B